MVTLLTAEPVNSLSKRLFGLEARIKGLSSLQYLENEQFFDVSMWAGKKKDFFLFLTGIFKKHI